MSDTKYTEGFKAGIAYEQMRMGRLLDEYISDNPKPMQETLRRRFAFVRGLINDKEAWQVIEGANK
jgi:hypothetical protein